MLFSFGQISALASHYKVVCENYRKENADLRKLADKPMAILDDAQGYYSVTDPFDKNASITVKDLSERNLRQRDLLEENNKRFAGQQQRIRKLEAQIGKTAPSSARAHRSTCRTAKSCRSGICATATPSFCASPTTTRTDCGRRRKTWAT